MESLRRVLTKPILSYFDSVSESVVAMFVSFALGHSLPVNILLEIHTPVSKALFAEAFGAASLIVWSSFPLAVLIPYPCLLVRSS